MSVQPKCAWFLTSLMLAEALVASGCGGNQAATSGELGGSTGVAGTSLVGPAANTGGLGAAGGAAATGAIGGVGGASSAASGGSFVSGGTSTGTSASATGGAPFASGGTTATGGVRNTGGMSTTGGSSAHPAAGSSSLTSGGSVAGGTNSSGGATTSLAGGTQAAGGTTSTGGLGTTGGNIASGGTSGSGTVPVFPKKFCGNITTSNKVDPTGLDFSRHWDQITPENAGKWASVQSGATAAFNWTALDAVYAYAVQHGITFKEHSLVWGAAQPSGIYTAANVENWIKAYCERYPKTALIDVVNEPPPHTTPNYAKALGEGESGAWPWIVNAFKMARRHCGSAVLILNDYNNLAYASSQTHYIDIVNDVRANGGPIDALGVQAHDASTLTATQLTASLETLNSQTGLPIYISEYDVSLANDSDQLAVFESQFPVFWNLNLVRGVTIWGWIMGYTWVQNSGLVNGTTPRPAMTWLMGYLGRPNAP